MLKLSQQPMNIAQILKISVSLWWQSLLYIWPLGLLIAVLEIAPLFPQSSTPGVPKVLAAFFLILSVILAILTLIPYTGIFGWMHAYTQGKLIATKDALRIGWQKFILVFGLSMILIIWYLLVCFIIIMPIYFLSHFANIHLFGIAASLATLIFICAFANYFLAYPLLIGENLGIIAAIKKSKQMIKNHWWQTVIIITLALIILSAIEYFLSLLGFPLLTIIVASILYPPFYASLLFTLLHHLQLQNSDKITRA